MKRRMKGASGTAGDTGDSPVAVNVRVRVHPGTDGEIRGTVVEDGWIVDRQRDRAERLVPLDAIHLLGPHLVHDVLAAATVGAIAGAAPAAMTLAVDAFRGLEHAMEPVAEIGGVRFVNDSKATNVESALRSIESFDRDLVPIMGGRFKGGDLRLLRDPLKARAKTTSASGQSVADATGAALGVTSRTVPTNSAEAPSPTQRPADRVLAARGLRLR